MRAEDSPMRYLPDERNSKNTPDQVIALAAHPVNINKLAMLTQKQLSNIDYQCSWELVSHAKEH